MKKIFSVLIVFTGFLVSAFGQDYKEYKLSNGIPVYAVKNTVNKIDSVSIVVKGGVNYYGSESSGLEDALFTMMMQGSARYSPEDIKAIKYETQSSFSSSSIFEGSILSLTSIDDYLSDTLPVLLNGFTNPSFVQSEYTKLITNYRENIQSMLNDPVKMSVYYSKVALYQNHPYEVSPGVTPDSINNITIPAMKNLHKQILDSRRIYVVAVTGCEPETYMPVLERELGSIKAGTYTLEDKEVPPVNVNKRPVVLSHGSAKDTGFYFRVVSAPSYASDEYIAFLLAKKIYNKIMHNVLRVKYGMCYTAETEDLGIKSNIAYEILFRCPSPDEIKQRMAEARNIMAQGKYIVDVDKNGDYILEDIDAALEGARNSVINSLYVSQLTTSGICTKKAASILLYDDITGIDRQYSQIKSVTSDEVLAVFNKYYNTDNEFWIACVTPELEEEIETLLRN